MIRTEFDMAGTLSLFTSEKEIVIEAGAWITWKTGCVIIRWFGSGKVNRLLMPGRIGFL